MRPSSEVGEGGSEGEGSSTVWPSSEFVMTDDEEASDGAVESDELHLVGFRSPSAQLRASLAPELKR